MLDAQRLEQARPEIIEHGLTGHLLDDGREHVGRRGVVKEMGPGLERDAMRQEGLRPRLIRRAWWFGLMPRGHAEQVADPHCLEVVARLGREILWKEL